MKGLLTLGIALVVALTTGSAMAADIGAKAPILKAPPMPVMTWAGCYVGATAGGDWAHSNVTWAPNPAGFPVSGPSLAALGTNTITSAGGTAGGEVGCNYQFNPMWVVGAEADFEWTGINSTLNVAFPGCAACGVGGAALGAVNITETVKSDWLATFRGRLGLVIGGNWLVYGTGGLAVANVSFTDFAAFAASATSNAVSVSNTKTGWTAGGGLEWMIAPHWSIKGEYLHVDLGTTNSTSANSNPVLFPVSTIAHSHSLTEEIGRAGVNFHF